jgi:hypothetical protein
MTLSRFSRYQESVLVAGTAASSNVFHYDIHRKSRLMQLTIGIYSKMIFHR